MHPTVNEDGGGRLWQTPVAHHDVWAAPDDLAHLARFHILTVGIDYTHLNAEGLAPRRSQTAHLLRRPIDDMIERIKARQQGSSLGHAVALRENLAPLLQTLPEQLNRHWRAAIGQA